MLRFSRSPTPRTNISERQKEICTDAKVPLPGRVKERPRYAEQAHSVLNATDYIGGFEYKGLGLTCYSLLPPNYKPQPTVTSNQHEFITTQKFSIFGIPHASQVSIIFQSPNLPTLTFKWNRLEGYCSYIDKGMVPGSAEIVTRVLASHPSTRP